MKKNILLLLTFTLTAMLFVGCSSRSTNQEESAPSEQSEPAQAETQMQTENLVPEENQAQVETHTQTDTQNNETAENQTATETQDHLSETNTTSESQNNSAANTDQAAANMIPEDRAKELALEHAGLSADQVTFIKSGIDYDNGRKHYDIEFYTDSNNEFDYEIDPYSGEILDYDYDAEYYSQQSDTPAGEAISMEEAKKIALSKVPGATEQNIRKFKSEYDDNTFQYEGKIFYDQKEYEFEIDGYSGDILEWDVENIHGNLS